MKYNKRIMFLYLTIMFVFTACSKHQHTFVDADCNNPAICSECREITGEALGHTSAIGVCSRCGEIGNKELLATLNTNFGQMMEAGTPLFSCLSGVTDLDANIQYGQFLEADKHTAAMASVYEEIIAVCTGYEELNGIVYQTNLLKSTCPPPISGSDATFLANQGVLYQLYLQQISSSCSYMSENLDYLAGNRDKQVEITYFEEVPNMPTPDSVIYGISYKSTENASGNIQYMYSIGDNETDAMLNYNLFLSAIETNTELKVDVSDSMVIVSQDGKMVSVMMGGNDVSIGYFLTVSFQG